MTDQADAIVVGSGINGMVSAAELARAGWSVILLERNAEIGGFIATEERTLPGYLHDTFSSWHPLFVSGPAYAALGELLHQHGLEYRNTDGWVTASVADDGRATFAHRDPERTAAEFAHAEDRSAYLAMLQRLGENMASIGGLLGSEVRSLAVVRHACGLARSGGLRGAEWWLRAAVTSGRAYLRRDFRGHEVDHLYAPWLLHAGLSPDHAAGGLMTPLFAGILHGFGLPVVAGGAGRFVVAFRSLLGSLGVRVETGFEVDRILVAHGRAVGVEAAGRTLRARRAVLASVTPGALYGRLLPEDAVNSALRAEAARFRHGRAAMQIHVALSEPLGWRNPRLAEIPLIHLSDGSAGTGIACAEAEAGLLPRHPTVVVGRQYLLDPARVPAGARRFVAAAAGGAVRAPWRRGRGTRHDARLDRGAGRGICQPRARPDRAARSRSARQDPRDRRPDAGRPARPQPQRRQRRSVRRLRRAGPELSVAATGLVGPPRDPGRPALAHRRLDPPGSGSRRRLRTSRRDRADQAQVAAVKQAYLHLQLWLAPETCTRREAIHWMGYAAGPGSSAQRSQ